MHKCADDAGKRNRSTHFLTCTLIFFLSFLLCFGWLKCLRRLNHGGAVATTAFNGESNRGDRQDDHKFTESQQSIPHERIGSAASDAASLHHVGPGRIRVIGHRLGRANLSKQASFLKLQPGIGLPQLNTADQDLFWRFQSPEQNTRAGKNTSFTIKVNSKLRH
jgi:hypothetical protein